MQTAEETIEIIKSIIQDTEPTLEEGRKLKKELAKLTKEQDKYIASRNFSKCRKLDKAIDEKTTRLIQIIKELETCKKLVKTALDSASPDYHADPYYPPSTAN